MRRLTVRRRIWRGLLGLLRAGAVLGLLLGGALLASARAAEERFAAGLTSFGDTLLRLEGFSTQSAPRRLSVNGVELDLVTLSTSDDVRTTIARLRGLCRKGGLFEPESLLGGPLAEESGLLDGAFERQSEHEGVLACIDTGGKLELEELVERLRAVRDTGDLSALGGVRYAQVRQSGKTTSVLALWTEGPLEVARMFPLEGDAPGHDPVGLPRPLGARRLLSAAEHAAPYGVTLYETTGKSPRAALDAQRIALEREGFTGRLGHDGTTFAAARDGRAVIFTAGSLAPDRTFMSVVELARR